MSRIFQTITVAGHRREINVRPRAERGCDTSIECEHLDELRGVATKAEASKTEYERALERVIAAAVDLGRAQEDKQSLFPELRIKHCESILRVRKLDLSVAVERQQLAARGNADK